MCICSIRIPSLEYSLFTWNLSIFRFNLAVLLPLWQNLLTFRSMIVFLFYRCVICIKHLNLQLRAIFCKCCYRCLMPVIFAWNSGCWSFSAKYLSDLCLHLSGKTCFNFGCWFPDLSVSQTSIFFRILYYFCHSRQLPWWSVFNLACYFHCGKIWWLSEVWSFFCFTGVSFASNI
jgi:hypothetical protein